MHSKGEWEGRDDTVSMKEKGGEKDQSSLWLRASPGFREDQIKTKSSAHSTK